ncbi:hypothetical protein B0H13DRAFT_1188385 [Mycena leptocephala]|nr:hypothetical protein B0H13DRAFT_1188385 [Mycena leptocephala]
MLGKRFTTVFSQLPVTGDVGARQLRSLILLAHVAGCPHAMQRPAYRASRSVVPFPRDDNQLRERRCLPIRAGASAAASGARLGDGDAATRCTGNARSGAAVFPDPEATAQGNGGYRRLPHSVPLVDLCPWTHLRKELQGTDLPGITTLPSCSGSRACFRHVRITNSCTRRRFCRT